MKKIALVALVFGLIGGCAYGVNSGTIPLNDAGAIDAASDTLVPDVVAEDAVQSPYDSGSGILPIPDGGFESGALDLNSAETLPMAYNGGPVLTNPINVYFIWYGNWTDKNTQPILESFINGLGASPWFAITAQYYQQPTDIIPDAGFGFGGSNHPYVQKVHQTNGKIVVKDGGAISDAGVTDSGSPDASLPVEPFAMVNSTVNFVQSVHVGSPLGSNLSDTDIPTIVAMATAADAGGTLPFDVNGVYFVLTSSEVTESGEFGGFCSDYCGWHEDAQILGQTMHISFVGDTGACQYCSVQQEYATYGITNSPNNDWSADGMASVIAHELAESATDPQPLTDVAWLDEYGEEVGDKCAWTFGKPYMTSSGSLANINIGGRDFMIQQNWVLDGGDAGQRCDLHP